MLLNLKALKEGKWAPSIQADIAHALQQADSRQRFVELLGQKRIGVVFRENEQGRIYGVTFIDHDRREVFNGSRMGKEFSANVFNDYFRWLDGISENDRNDIRQWSSGSITGTRRARKARSSRRRVSSPWKPTQGITRRSFRTPYEKEEESQTQNRAAFKRKTIFKNHLSPSLCNRKTI